MSPRNLVLSAPEPRSLDLIFDGEARADLHRRYRVLEASVDTISALDDRTLGEVRYIIGQPPINEDLLARLSSLRCIFNVESNLIDNMPYEEVFRRGIHVLTTGRVFARPVAELGLGLALSILRDIPLADADFRRGKEIWGMQSNSRAKLLGDCRVGIIGFGELGRAMARLLSGFGCSIYAYDPWLPPSILSEAGVTSICLDALLRQSDLIFVMAAVTSENEGCVGAQEFSIMKPGTAVVLLSRANAVDFDAFVDAASRGHIRGATDVYPVEPLPLKHPARYTTGLLHSAHRAGGLDCVFKQMGRMVLEDMALVDQDLPPLVCKRAERETARRMRSKPVGGA